MIFSARVHIILAMYTLHTFSLHAMAPVSAASPSIQQQHHVASDGAWNNLMNAMLADKPQEIVTPLLNTWQEHGIRDTSLTKSNEHGELLIHTAARKGYSEVLSTLCTLYKSVSNIDMPTENHEKATALHCAAHAGNVSAVVTLIEHGANTNAKTTAKITPVLMALFGYNTCSNQTKDLERKTQYHTIVKNILDKQAENIDLQEFTAPRSLQRLFSLHEKNTQKKDAH